MSRSWVTRCVALVLATLLAAACGVNVAPPARSPSPSAPVSSSPSGAASPATATLEPSVSVVPSATPIRSPGVSPTPAPPASPTPVPSPTLPPSFPSTIDRDLGARIQAEIDRVRVLMDLPGVSVAVRLPSGETWTGVSGLASIVPEEPVTPRTVFAIASVTKTFVAALILRLAEEGVLSIDDPLSRYLPAFPRADRITLRQMLAHTSGIHDYFQNDAYRTEVFADRTQTWTFDEILGFVLGPRCRPGVCFHYSNTNYVLLGRVAEIATGRPLAALLRNRFFEPLGLEQTVFQPDDETPADRAHGHLRAPTGMIDFTGDFRIIPHPSATTVAWAAGNIASTPTDLVTWGSALYGGRVLQPESLAEMLTFTAPYGGYGLGVYRFEFHDRPAVGHTGGIHGFVSVMAHLPDDGVTIAVTANRGKSSPFRVLRHVMAVILGIRPEA